MRHEYAGFPSYGFSNSRVTLWWLFFIYTGVFITYYTFQQPFLKKRRLQMNDDAYKKLATVLDTLPNGFPETDDGKEIKLLKKIFSD